MLQIIRERPTLSEPFIHAEHLENIRDWKSFITLYLRKDAFVGISKLHHFRFYMQDNKSHVQYKDYARSLLWIPKNGHIFTIEPGELNQRMNLQVCKRASSI